jgi:hypothetical protein
VRLEAQARLGYYPAHPECVAACLAHLRLDPAKADQVRLFDPCCGKAAAVAQFADALTIPRRNVYAVELEPGRAALAREALGPEANLFGPASYMGVEVTPGSIGLAWVNPPFDYELGGGQRQEQTFAERVTPELCVGGVLALVLPFTAIRTNSRFQKHLDTWFADARLYAFPSGEGRDGQERRPFREVVYFGVRRDEPRTPGHGSPGYLESLELWRDPPLPVVGSGEMIYTVPPTRKPARFAKVQLTEEELREFLAKSPLQALLEPPRPIPPKTPPMPLGEGHVALILASGLLNGYIEALDGYGMVVRGTARKVQYLSEKKKPTVNEKTGEVSQQMVFSQRPVVEIRAIDASGFLGTFGEKGLAEQMAEPVADAGEGEAA